jgi:predicted alpha/beta hydrolase
MIGSEVIRTRDGKKLSVSVYKSQEDNNSVLVIGPSLHCTQDTYRSLANFLCDHHYTVITFDYRGTGASAGRSLRNDDSRLHQWARLDLDAVLLFVKNNHPEKEIIFLAHGISGELSGLAAASQYISKMVLINSALTCSALWPLKGRIRKSIIKVFVPALHFVFGYFPRIKPLSIPRLPRGVMNEWVSWCNRSNGLFELYSDNNYRKLQVPMLALSFSDDPHSPRRAVAALLGHFTSAQLTWQHTDPGDHGLDKVGHTGFFHAQVNNVLWNYLLSWLQERVVSSSPNEPNTVRS